MIDPEKKEKRTKKSRPKSAVVNATSIKNSDGGERKERSHRKTGDRETKRSHSRREGSSRVKSDTVDNSALHSEIEALKKALESSKQQFEQKIASLQKENDELSQKVQNKKSSSNSSSDEELKEQLQAEQTKLKELTAKLEEHESTIANLKKENTHFKAANEQREKDLVSETHRLQDQIKELTEKQIALEKEVQDLKSSSYKPAATQQKQNSATFGGNSVTSPRNQATGNIPAWKQRELEKQKELEEQIEREARTKLQKVQSLKRENNIITEGNKNFKDPALNKPTFHHGGVINEENSANESDTKPIVPSDMTEQEKIEAEMERLNRTFKRGGHTVAI